MTGAKDGDRPLSSDDRVHVRIKRFSQKEAGREREREGYLKTARRASYGRITSFLRCPYIVLYPETPSV